MNILKFKYGLIILILSALIGCRKNDNRIYVTTTNALSVDKVEIRKGFISINRESDMELFSKQMKTVFDKVDKRNLETVFGENDFLVLYNEKYYYSFRHFIETDFVHEFPKGHDYNFSLYKKNDTIFCKVDIKGEIPMKFTRFLTDVDLAKNRLGNTPKDKAGAIFNMKEMEKK